MLDVSAAWRAAILDPLVIRQFRIMARIDLSGSILVSGIASISTPAADETTKTEQLADGILGTDYAYASLDAAWTVGDGKRVGSTVYGQTGYVGTQISGSTGAFSTYEQLTFVMSAPTLINRVTVAFDDKLGEHAVDFDIAFYNAGGTEIGRWAVTGNGSDALSLITGTGYTAVSGVLSYKLIVKTWSAAGRTCKVTECYSGSVELVTGDDRLVSMVIDEASESTGSSEVGSVMASVLTMALDNSDRRYSRSNPDAIIYGIDVRKKRIQTFAGLIYADGSTEMLPMGTYNVDDWSETDGDTTVTVKATDMMAALDKVTYVKTSSLTYPATLASLVQDIFACAGFGVLYEIDDAYNSLTIPIAPNFETASCREALRYCAQVMNGSILQTRAAKIRCTAHVISDGASESELFGASVLQLGPDAYFSGSKSSDNTGGATRVTVKYGADDACQAVKIDAAEESKNGITELTISGNPILKTLPTNAVHPFWLAGSVLKYCGYKRKWLDCSWRGNPALEAGDTVTFMGTDGSTKTCRMSKQTMTLDGSLKVASTMRY